MGTSDPDSALPGPIETFARFADGSAGRVLAILVLATAVLIAVGMHFGAPLLPYDDAFITFRYVDNCIDGKGLVYNEGQRVCGFSTITYPFWLMLLKALFPAVALPALAVRGNCVPFVAAGIAVFFLVRRVTGNRLVAAAAAAALLVSPTMLAVSAGGMEPFLFTAFLLFACLALASDRPVLFGVLAALAVLTRPEAVVLLPAAVAAYWKRWRRLGVALAAFAPLPAAWGVFAFSYYGSMIPLSIVAKMKPLYPLPPGHALRALIVCLEDALTGATLGSLRQLRTVFAVDLVILASAACVIHRPSRRSFAWMCPLLFWTFLVMYFQGNPLVPQWYWPPVFVVALGTIVAGVPAGAALARTWLAGSGRRTLAARVVPAVLIAGAAWLATVTAFGYRMTSADSLPSVLNISEDPTSLRIVGYRQAAEMLNRVIRPGERVAAPEVGSLGYYLKGYVIDSCALVSPEALPYLPVPEGERLGPENGAISVELVQGMQPEWVVTMPTFAARSLLASDWFRRNYQAWGKAELPRPLWGSDAIYIFRKSSDSR